MIKTEDEEASADNGALLLLDRDLDELTGIIDKLSTLKPLCKSETPQRDVKVEGCSLSQAYYIPTGASEARPSVPAVSSSAVRVTYKQTPPSDAYHHRQTNSISPLDLNALEQRCAKTSPTPRPGTELSYLKPLTPTPFSTPYGLVNPSPYAANLHCVSGSLLEGLRRRTRWGNKTRPAKQAALGTQARNGLPVERLYGIENEMSGELEGDAEQKKTCAWYKLLFCKCCKWSMTAIPQSSKSITAPPVSTSPPLSKLKSGVVLRGQGTIQRQIRVASSSLSVPASKGVRKKRWWQFRERKLPYDIERKRRLTGKSTREELEAERVPQLNPRRRCGGVSTLGHAAPSDPRTGSASDV
jgi:hypothetical protein